MDDKNKETKIPIINPNSYDALGSELMEEIRKNNDLEQQIFLLKEIKEYYKQKRIELDNELIHLRESHMIDLINEKELSQVNLLSKNVTETQHKINLRMSKKFYILIAIISVGVVSGFISFSYSENQIFLETATNILANYKTGYLVQNLKGDVINTWVSWAIAPDRVLHVDIVNTAGVSEDKINAVKDAIISKNVERIDDSLLHKGPQGSVSTYYDGWEGALTKASTTKTQLIIPVKFNVEVSNSNTGDVMIILSTDTNPDGYTGFTKSISDEHNILRSTTTIYQANDLSVDQIKAITRHEFGHVLGLAHSTAPEDLMHATIDTQYPYISDCDISAITALYDGKESSQVVCTK